MPEKNLTIVLVTTFFAFSTLYIPQPILPLLAATYNVSAADASLLVSATMILLGITPIMFSRVLQAIAAHDILRPAIFLLAISNLLLAIADQFWQLLLLRVLQGLLLPVIFTALMTHCSAIAASGKVRLYMAYYVATTIFGGFCGRVFSGGIATWTDWHYSFGLLFVALLFNWALLGQLDRDVKSEFVRPNPGAIRKVLQQPVFRYALLTIFSAFFTFSALLNALPFRLVEISPSISEFTISTVYSGYLIGIIVALSSQKIVRALGGQATTLAGAFAVYLIALLLFLVPDTVWMFVCILCASLCFFLLHSLLSGFVNHIADGDSGAINGLYVSFYYVGGSLGAWLPAFVYRDFGWGWFTALLCAVLLLACLFSDWMRRAARSHAPQR